jgi:hypothetical protein
VHLLDPVPQAVHDELQRPRVGHVQRVAAAGEVHVVAAVVGQPVVGGVVDPAEAERGPQVVALGRVVVDDVEDDLDPLLVEDLHHRLELVDVTAGRPRRGVANVRSEEVDRVVTPVVREAAVAQVLVADEVVDRHQLDRRHAEIAQVGQRGRRHQPRVRPTQVLGHPGMPRGEALDVHLVDHRLVPRRARSPIIAPGEGGVDDDRLRHAGRTVARIGGQVGVGMADLVAEESVAPLDGAVERSRVGIEQELGGVEAVAGGGLPGALHAIAVADARPRLRQVDVPDVLGLLGHGDARLAAVVEQAELDGLRVLGEESEVHARAVPGRAERIGPAWSCPYRRRPGSRGHTSRYKRT